MEKNKKMATIKNPRKDEQKEHQEHWKKLTKALNDKGPLCADSKFWSNVCIFISQKKTKL